MSPDKCRLELRMQLGSAEARGRSTSSSILVNCSEQWAGHRDCNIGHPPAAKRWKMSKQTEMSCFWKELSEQE
jgi:hypothetical protein